LKFVIVGLKFICTCSRSKNFCEGEWIGQSFKISSGSIEEENNFSLLIIYQHMISLNVNQKEYQVDVNPDMPLLWVIRDVLGLTGTKYGCGVAQCGACMVHVNGESVFSCVTKVGSAAGKKIVTIEGLSVNNNHPIQLAWQELDVPQCGYCQSGQILSAAVLLRENPNPTDEDIDSAMAGNICRCGTYLRIRKAIHRAAEIQRNGGK
jgi:isoquinoline 1-oxidoreductase subunit alpha